MGMDAQVIDLTAWRDAKVPTGEDRPTEGFDRVEAAMHDLEHRVKRGAELAPRHETDLLAITGALSLGLYDEAAERIERLAVRVEHPAGRGRA
jgi:hypothetical protein